MVVRTEHDQLFILLINNQIEQVDMIRYLGVNIIKDGRKESKLNERLEKANRLYYALYNKFVRKNGSINKNKSYSL